jgi:hypothetical protein
MPTYFTDLIDSNPNLTTKKWMIENLSRYFAIFTILKEESFTMTEEQVLKAIEKDYDVEYHIKELDSANTELIRLSKLTEDQWLAEWEVYANYVKISNAKSLERANKKQERHLKVMAELQQVMNTKDISDFTKSVANLGLEQLELVKIEREPYNQEIITPAQFKLTRFGNARRNVSYHTEELAKAKQRARDRHVFYKQLRKDLDKVFPEETKQ